MLPEDSWPEQVAGTYSRAAIEHFLREAEAARERVEALLDIANQRRRMLHADLADVLERNARVTRELVHTTREMHDDRLSHTSAVAAVLAAAEAEAAAILGRARTEAATIRGTIWSEERAQAAGAHPRLALVQSESDDPTPNEPPLLVC